MDSHQSLEQHLKLQTAKNVLEESSLDTQQLGIEDEVDDDGDGEIEKRDLRFSRIVQCNVRCNFCVTISKVPATNSRMLLH